MGYSLHGTRRGEGARNHANNYFLRVHKFDYDGDYGSERVFIVLGMFVIR